ncbi:DUF4097 family beta strand repeat protein [Candidatus Woesearchaeota archaeon]|nr:DUF4097 family beta strand repeat protein [Candidatus Woesearchaeota archaeon]
MTEQKREFPEYRRDMDYRRPKKLHLGSIVSCLALSAVAAFFFARSCDVKVDIAQKKTTIDTLAQDSYAADTGWDTLTGKVQTYNKDNNLVVRSAKTNKRSTVEINGKRYRFDDAQSISVVNGRIIVDGKPYEPGDLPEGEPEKEINKTYNNVRQVNFDGTHQDINLRLSTDNRAKVEGTGISYPTYSLGRLNLGDLEGIVHLPRSCSELDLETMSGDISGDVAQRGRIETMSGDITLDIYAPVNVRVNTMSGDVSVNGMMSRGARVYSPPKGDGVDTLNLETMLGDIRINYKGE